MKKKPKIIEGEVVETKPNKKTKAVAKVEKNVVTQNSAEMLISRAIDKNVSVDTMERLLAMRRELKAEFAKEKFDKAMSNFQSECPEIKKTKEVRTNTGQVAYRYAPIEVIVAQVKDILKRNGFSYSVQTETGEKNVKSICIVKHIAGHSEKYNMEVPLGNKTQVMSDSQVVAAALTFAKRYAFCNAFGILTGDEDTDGKVAEEKIAPAKCEPRKSKPQDLKEVIRKAVNSAKKVDDLIELDKKTRGSDKFDDVFKKEIHFLVDLKVTELENAKK